MTTMPAAAAGPLAQAAPAAAAACAPLAAAADRDAALSGTAQDAIRDAGFLRHYVPARWGGTDGTFTDCLLATALLAAADPAAAWCAALAASAARMCAFLPGEGQHDLWAGSPDTLVTVTLHPGGTARPDGSGGWHASGRWPFATSAADAGWALLSCKGPGGGPVFLLVPRQDWHALDDWDGTGLRATRSGTLELPAARVPAHRAFPRSHVLDGLPDTGQASLRVPHEAVSGLTFAAPMLGAARAAVTAWAAAVARRGQAHGPGEHAEVVLARAAGEADAACLLLERAAAAADHPALAALDAARSRRDCWLAATLITSAVSQLHATAGIRATSRSGALARLWRDVSTAAVHPALQPQPAAAEWAALALARP
jgi:two-component flavin-dependent monooxygenase